MARARLISKSLGSSRRFYAVLKAGGKLGEFCQVLFMLIVPNTDDFGRMQADAFTVKNVVLPSSPRSEAEFDRALTALQEVGLIDRYVVNGAMYLQVRQFDVHQVNLHKRTPSQFPEPPSKVTDHFSRKVAEDPECDFDHSRSSENTRSNLRELELETNLSGKRTETISASGGATDRFALFWAAYPKKRAKAAARKAWDHHRPDDALTQIILAAIASQRQSPEWINEDGRFIPYPATWLHRGQWTDEPRDTTLPLGQSVSDRTVRNLANQEAAIKLIKERANGTGGE